MAKATEETRRYRFSDSEMVRISQQIASFASRDLNDFALFGIKQSYLNDFERECNEFETFIADEIMEGRQSEATALKDSYGAALRDMLRAMLLRVELRFGKDSPQSRMYKIGDVSRLNDNELLAASRRTHLQAKSHLAELEQFGLTQAILDELIETAQKFEDALHQRAMIISERDNLTEQRIKKGNALYDKLTTLCEIGKQVWFNKSESRYNDYVIYNRYEKTENNPENPNNTKQVSA